MSGWYILHLCSLSSSELLSVLSHASVLGNMHLACRVCLNAAKISPVFRSLLYFLSLATWHLLRVKETSVTTLGLSHIDA